MALNIKSREAHQLAQELAALTGESMTAAVTQAMRERLERLRRERDGRTAGRERPNADDPVPPFGSAAWSSMSVDELLYDERGMPHGTPC